MTRHSIALAVALVVMLAAPRATSGYRPFVSTDAAVADPREVEIELGYFNLERTSGRSTFTIPAAVLNYGLFDHWEVVGEFGVEVGPRRDLTDPALFVKGVLRDGVLQERTGPSLAVEAGPLLPSTVRSEHHVGFAAVGILSARLPPFTVHVNVGGGLDRTASAFANWGVIGELPVGRRLRLVGEVNGESTRTEQASASGLVGLIWQPTSRNVFLDTGLRRGLSGASADWQVTVGVTFGFLLPRATSAASTP